ncbi:MAG: hypothetical protein OER88_12720, partial [Planctomycetota bacterium]|nr:hypothetical protein [Planctomycetota bacterium]
LKLRNMVIEEGGEVRVVGPNPLSIQATGTVIVRGLLDLSGFNGKDVATLNTGHQPEIGAAGAAGGGHGGTASFETMMSTPRGGSGEGAFRRVGAGAQGGESGYAPVGLGKSARRPGGGGGGRFAADQGDLLSRPGGNGHPMSRGAESDLQPAMGGVPNASILVDGNPDNDYFGLKPVVEGGVLVDRLRGELRQPSAGVGGGAGGDAVPANTFPHPNWSPASDEKGGPGGGGGGQLRVRALGPIVFGRLGEIRCNGGRGGTGENTLFLDHVGGTGGSGSGGHVILETAMYVDFTDGDPGAPVGDRIRAVGGPRFNGAPTDFPEVSFGGRGGPGIIQLHVPRPERGVGPSPDVAGVVLPLEALFAQNALDEVTSPQGILLYPTVGTLSSGQSDWIPLGAADESSGGVDLVSFLFAGTETTPGPDEGRILTDDTHVRAAAPLFGPALLAAPNAEIGVDRRTLTLRGDALAFGSSGQLYNDVFLRTPALLRHFRLRLERADNATVFFDHEVAHAVYDDVEATLSITVVTNAEDLADFIENAAGGAVIYTVTPRFFRANSSLGRDRIPGGTRIRLLFQAATDDGAGNPADPPLVDWTADPRSFNSLSPGALDFFRFRVEFDLDTEGTGFDPEMAPLELDFLRLPFRF